MGFKPMNKDQLRHMTVLDRTMFATEMKDKAYVQDLDMLSVYGQDDLVPLVFAVREMLVESESFCP
jgi:hypothetical protein